LRIPDLRIAGCGAVTTARQLTIQPVCFDLATGVITVI